MDKKTYLAAGLGLLISGALGAQNLNPQVQVTNDYEARMSQQRKTELYMQVPDSLTRFDTKVDYSVFETAYKGAYEFNPYAVTVVPEAREFSGNTLFLKAGAGYSFHPLLQAVYTPKKQGDFRADVYGGVKGYGGRYRRDFVLGKDDPASFSGHDYSLDAGAEARWNLDKVNLYGNLDYDGILTRDDVLSGGFHEGSFSGRIASASRNVPLYYDLGGRAYGFKDKFGQSAQKGVGFTLDATLIPAVASLFDVVVDAGMEGNFYGSALKGAFSTTFNPRAVFNWQSIQLSAGFTVGLGTKLGIYPDLRARMNFFDGLFSFYAGVTGGQNLNDYASLKKQEHWFNTAWIPEEGLGVSAVKLDAFAGLTGKVFADLQYDLRAGYDIKDDALLLAMDPATYACGFAYADYRELYATASLAWKSDRIELDCSADYRNADIARRQDFADNPSWVAVAPFTGEIRAVYNWNHRVFAGASLSGMARRQWNAGADKVRGFCLAGLSFEYLLSRRISIWANADNIFNQRITISPTHIPGGINFTAGICLRLQ